MSLKPQRLTSRSIMRWVAARAVAARSFSGFDHDPGVGSGVGRGSLAGFDNWA